VFSNACNISCSTKVQQIFGKESYAPQSPENESRSPKYGLWKKILEFAVRLDSERFTDDLNAEYEINFLKFMEKITNGCVVEINETGR